MNIKELRADIIAKKDEQIKAIIDYLEKKVLELDFDDLPETIKVMDYTENEIVITFKHVTGLKYISEETVNEYLKNRKLSEEEMKENVFVKSITSIEEDRRIPGALRLGSVVFDLSHLPTSID